MKIQTFTFDWFHAILKHLQENKHPAFTLMYNAYGFGGIIEKDYNSVAFLEQCLWDAGTGLLFNDDRAVIYPVNFGELYVITLIDRLKDRLTLSGIGLHRFSVLHDYCDANQLLIDCIEEQVSYDAFFAEFGLDALNQITDTWNQAYKML